MIELIHSGLNQYIEKQYEEKDPVLLEMQEYGLKRQFPFVGPQVGRLLFILAKLLDAKRIFEMGSGFGYSAYWFAKALEEQGKVYQTEGDPENSKKARTFFAKGKLEKKSEFLIGNALSLIDQIPGEFDIVFLDLDKENYPLAFEKTAARIRSGGLLIADNTLWSGKVIEPNPDADTQGIQKFTRLLFGDKRFFAAILPIRDGVAVGYKS